MREIVEFLSQHNRLYKSFEKIDNKLYKIRKKIDIYNATSLKREYELIFKISQKSRFISKDVDSIVSLEVLMSEKLGHNFKKITLFINSPLCSKAKNRMTNELKWKVFHDAL